MPFTPFHWGPALLIGLLLFQLLDFPSLIVSSVAPDLEGLYIVVFRPFMPHHGLVHTYVFASVIGIMVAVVMYSLRELTGKVMAIFGLRQTSSFKKSLYTSLLGVYSHIFLDSFLYPEMRPFYPLEGNPFVGVASEYVRYVAVYGLCGLSLLIGMIIYFKKEPLRLSSAPPEPKRKTANLALIRKRHFMFILSY